MTAHYQCLQAQDVQISESHEAFALDVLIGLSQTPKSLPSKYFYDEEGSKLFQQITELPEYYLTQCESEIFHSKKDEIARLVNGSRFNLVELGAGDGRKTKILLEHFLKAGLDFRYVPIDICEATPPYFVISPQISLVNIQSYPGSALTMAIIFPLIFSGDIPAGKNPL